MADSECGAVSLSFITSGSRSDCGVLSDSYHRNREETGLTSIVLSLLSPFYAFNWIYFERRSETRPDG
ncbi:hypothetical protein BJY00DRAFT_292908 [Aspergillus carlsbadensis]|nr:hypothetical protein BJY00DRAFT_292908 [Aspergillus carlsbadensis]